MIRNLVEIGTCVFTDDQILFGEASGGIGLVSEDLPAGRLQIVTTGQACAWEQLQDADELDLQDADELDLVVLGEAGPVDMTAISFGDEAIYTHDRELVGRYYVQEVRRIGKNAWRIESFDALGLLARQKHNGGIYEENVTASALIADLMGDIPYTIRDAEISSILVTGYLPIASRRDNLQQLLFAYGISALYDSDGQLVFCFNKPEAARTVQKDDAYEDKGGNADHLAKASKVRVTEHGFYEGTASAEVLYQITGQSAAVTNARVEFGGPYHSLDFGTFTEIERGVNYAVVSGTGVLTGIPYIHTRRELIQSAGIATEDRDVRVPDATLVTASNSAGVLARVAALYLQAHEVSCPVVLNGEKPGDMIAFTDPFGDSRTGYVKSRTITMSGTLKTVLKVAVEWAPGHLGSDFSDYFIVEESDLVNGNVEIPAAYVGKRARAVLFGGSRGGWAGYEGQPGGTVKGFNDGRFGWYEDYPDGWAEGGAPGLGGKGGDGVKILTMDIPALEQTYPASIGDGGLGGEDGDVRTEGELGGDTTLTVSGTTYSTEGGTEISVYRNLVDGSIVAEPGDAGRRGGAGGGAGRTYKSTGTIIAAESGEPVMIGGSTYSGGAAGESNIGSSRKQDGGGGGGATVGTAGSAGSSGDRHKNRNGLTGEYNWVYEGGDGGDGASCTTPPVQASAGKAGTGGFGGGGGGAAGAAAGNGGPNDTDEYEIGKNGKGGKGGPGGKGGKGLILFYVEA